MTLSGILVSYPERATRASSTSAVRNVCSATRRRELGAYPPSHGESYRLLRFRRCADEGRDAQKRRSPSASEAPLLPDRGPDVPQAACARPPPPSPPPLQIRRAHTQGLGVNSDYQGQQHRVRGLRRKWRHSVHSVQGNRSQLQGSLRRTVQSWSDMLAVQREAGDPLR